MTVEDFKKMLSLSNDDQSITFFVQTEDGNYKELSGQQGFMIIGDSDNSEICANILRFNNNPHKFMCKRYESLTIPKHIWSVASLKVQQQILMRTEKLTIE